ncbi:MAG: response regulator [Ignavibacteriae bacterium]|nr:response regulator [Ignavibacteriota bacterium]
MECPAQTSRFFDAWRWVEFDLESGLPSNHTYAILETEQGTPWVITKLGVAWYDDYVWHQVPFPARTPLSKPQSFYSDRLGRVIVVHDSSLFIGDTTGFVRLDIASVLQAAPLTDGGVMLVRGELGKPKSIDIWNGTRLVAVESPGPIAAGDVPGLWQTQTGSVWLTAGNGLFSFERAAWRQRFRAQVAAFSLACARLVENDSGSGLALIYRPFASRGLWEWKSDREFVLNSTMKGEDIVGADIAPDGTAFLAFSSGYSLMRYHGRWSSPTLERLAPRQVEMVKFRRNGDLWVCTERGLRLFKYSSTRWQFESKRSMSPDMYVNDILLATDSSLWLATGGGLRVIRKDGTETSIRQILGRTIYTATGLLEDRNRNMWVSSGSDFTGAYRWNGIQWRRVGIGTPLDSTHIHRMHLDKKGRVWLLGISKSLEPARDEREPGAFVFDVGKITRWGVPEGLSGGRVYAVEEGNDGSLWFGTLAGLSCWKNGAWQHRNRQQLFSAQKVFALAFDKQGRLWFADGKGIVGTIDSTGVARRITTDDGLLDTRVLEIRVDEKNRVWCTTPVGLAVYADGAWGEFDESSGILNANLWPVLPTRDRVFVGSHSGLTILTLTQNDFEAPRVYLDPAMTSGRTALLRWKAIARWNEIPSRQIQTRYRIDDQPWSRWSTARELSLLDLAPGNHNFDVQTKSILGGVRSFRTVQQPVTITIPLTEDPRIMAPVGVVFLILLVFAIGTSARERREKQRRLREELRLEHEHSERLAQVDKLKSRFFANISHEFRTPLTLVIGPIGQALSKIEDTWAREKLGMAHRNAEKLHDLINQLLDFSRIESGTMKIAATRGDVVPFVQRIVQSFHSWAEQKKQKLEFISSDEKIEGLFDRSNLEKILNNLISNALKFSPEKGEIIIRLSVAEYLAEDRTQRKRMLISVSDTGIGISADHLPHIFDRFYRVDDSHVIEGTGIGLALTKELVELLHGQMTVESEVGKGTEFTVLLPLEFDASEIAAELAPEPERSLVSPLTESSGDRPAEKESDDSAETIVLIVEDSDDVRAYVKEYLTDEYSVIEARDGSEGLAKACAVVPDLVISDVMMPMMDGYELARELKRDERTSHIPIILLTARAGAEDKLEGLELGADDYLTKPFDARELLARAKNLIEGRRRLREKLSKSVPLRPGEVALASMEDEFLKKAIDVVDRCMGDERFSVDQFSLQMNMSRMQLYRKLRALTNQSATEFVRRLRLQRAHDMLVKKVGTISEIAYQTGFGSLTYFERCYHEQFGCTPRDTRAKLA